MAEQVEIKTATTVKREFDDWHNATKEVIETVVTEVRRQVP